jgi:hypothetical protein
MTMIELKTEEAKYDETGKGHLDLAYDLIYEAECRDHPTLEAACLKFRRAEHELLTVIMEAYPHLFEQMRPGCFRLTEEGQREARKRALVCPQGSEAL